MKAYYEMPLPTVQKAIIGSQLTAMTLPRTGHKNNNQEYANTRNYNINVRLQDNASDMTIISTASNSDSHVHESAANFHSNFDLDCGEWVWKHWNEEALRITSKETMQKSQIATEKESIYMMSGQYFVTKTKPERKEIKKLWKKRTLWKTELSSK